MMGNAFYPDEWLDSAYDIPYEQFYQKGMRGIIFDIDNTLVPHGAPADERAVQLFERLRAIGFHTCLLSNNKEARVAPFAGQVDSDYIYKGRKPKRSGNRQAMRRSLGQSARAVHVRGRERSRPDFRSRFPFWKNRRSWRDSLRPAGSRGFRSVRPQERRT